jgi:hypothetical protein
MAPLACDMRRTESLERGERRAQSGEWRAERAESRERSGERGAGSAECRVQSGGSPSGEGVCLVPLRSFRRSAAALYTSNKLFIRIHSNTIRCVSFEHYTLFEFESNTIRCVLVVIGQWV